jgi:hypothetical protein
MADLNRLTSKESVTGRTNPANSRISSKGTALKRDGSTGMVIRGGDGASIGDYMDNPRRQRPETTNLYKDKDEIYKGEGILPKFPTTRPTEREIDLENLYKTPRINRLKSLDDMAKEIYGVDKKGRLQPDKQGFSNYMSDKLFEACMTYFSNVGQRAKPTDGTYAAQRQGMSKRAGYNLTDLTGTFYDVANGKLQASKQGFSAYMNLSLTNAAFQYFGNIGKKAPAGYISGKKAPSPARYLPAGKK